MTSIYYSTDEEIFNADSIHECICDFGEGEIVTIYQGEAVQKSASDFAHFDHCDLSEHAIDQVGDYADSWLTGVTQEQQFDLQVLIEHAVDEWADKHNKQPTFYGVKNIKEITVKVLADGEYEVQDA